jgi:hypothetical protein
MLIVKWKSAPRGQGALFRVSLYETSPDGLRSSHPTARARGKPTRRSMNFLALPSP